MDAVKKDYPDLGLLFNHKITHFQVENLAPEMTLREFIETYIEKSKLIFPKKSKNISVSA